MPGFNYISALTQITQMKKHTPLKIHLSRSRANKISNFLVFVRYFQQTWIAHRWYQHYLNLPHYLGVILKSKPPLGAFVHAYAWNYLAVELVSTVNFSQKKIRLFYYSLLSPLQTVPRNRKFAKVHNCEMGKEYSLESSICGQKNNYKSSL